MQADLTKYNIYYSTLKPERYFIRKMDTLLRPTSIDIRITSNGYISYTNTRGKIMNQHICDSSSEDV